MVGVEEDACARFCIDASVHSAIGSSDVVHNSRRSARRGLRLALSGDSVSGFGASRNRRGQTLLSTAGEPSVQKVENVLDFHGPIAVEVRFDLAGKPGIEVIENILNFQSAGTVVVRRAHRTV